MPALFAVYFLCLHAWHLTYLLAGDRWGWLFVANTFAPILFSCVPFLFVGAWIVKRRDLVFLGGSALLVAGWWFAPAVSLGPVQGSGAADLAVMSYNVHADNVNSDGISSLLRRSDADIVCLQELNPVLAAAIQTELADVFPYQLLEPASDSTGMGVISRFPIRHTDATIGGSWIGRPQTTEVLVDNNVLGLINLHMPSVPLLGGDFFGRVRQSTKIRQDSALHLRTFVAQHDTPLIVAGDFNTTPLSTTYSMIVEALDDAWVTAGAGSGHTFPGGPLRPSVFDLKSPPWLPRMFDLKSPPWLLRIDYIFLSQDLRAVDARVGPWDGVSDHRPVIVNLSIPSHPGVLGDP